MIFDTVRSFLQRAAASIAAYHGVWGAMPMRTSHVSVQVLSAMTDNVTAVNEGLAVSGNLKRQVVCIRAVSAAGCTQGARNCHTGGGADLSH